MHIPVLQKEVILYLNPKADENFVDATIGQGGHTSAILEKTATKGKVLGIEIDPVLYEKSKTAGGENRLIVVNDSYVNLKEIVKKHNFKPIHGILFDLGISSWHLENSGRGFTFQKEEPLDMRYNATHIRRPLRMDGQITAEKIINEWSGQEIEKILREYGEEKFACRIADAIIKFRETKPIKTTFQLVALVRKAIPQKYWPKKIHFATKTFQALRIAVNDELNNLKKTLPQTLELLEKGGRLTVISFHSGEDKIVKNFLRENFKKNRLKIMTKKPLVPSKKELELNPRARSAKLRAAVKI